MEAVREALREKPWNFGFFQAVRLLHRMEQDRQPLGAFSRPGEEVVRLSVPTTISFPASEVQALDFPGSAAPDMTVNFLGLLGPQGVLPYWYSVVVEEATRGRNRAARDFLDIFQHRMLSHFYRAWEKARSEVAFERGADDHLAPVVRAIVGLNTPGLEGRMSVADTAMLFYAGLLGPSQRSAIGLEQVLADYFEVPVRVEQFSGGWFELDPDAFLRLGEDDVPSAQLGVGAVVGTAIWNEQARVRIRVGPLARADFERFLPTGTAHGELRELVRFYSDDAVDFDLQLVLRQDDVPPTVLGQADSLPLGWGSWLRTRPSDGDKDQVVFPL